MKIFCAAAAVAAAALLGCGHGEETSDAQQPAGGKELRHLDITLNGPEGPENVGILMARDLGYFADVGIEVGLYRPGRPNRPLPYLVQRLIDLSVSHEPQVALAKAEGLPVIAVGSLVAQPTASLIWLPKSGIRGVRDLEGKVIAYPGIPFQKKILESVLRNSGLDPADVTVKAVGYDSVPSLVNGRVDAIFGGSANVEGSYLESRGFHPVIVPAGRPIPAYDELVVAARTDWARENRQVIHDFLSALDRGTAAAIADPEAAALASRSGEEADPALDVEAAEKEVEATLPLLSRDAYMDPRQGSRLIAWMYRQGLISRRLPVSALLTNSFSRPTS